MAWLDLLELLDLVTSWRFYVGIAVKILLVCLVAHFIPSETMAWWICIPLGIAGFIVSLTWQADADAGR